MVTRRSGWIAQAGAWAPAVGWAVLLFLLSTETFAASSTGRWIESIVRLFWPQATAPFVRDVHFLVRKVAHVGAYFTFALLLDRGFRSGTTVSAPSRFLGAFSIAAAYSLTDELHQSFVHGRTAAIGDCGFDCLGAALASLFLWIRNPAEEEISAYELRGTARRR
jgi:VanZ family protein